MMTIRPILGTTKAISADARSLHGPLSADLTGTNGPDTLLGTAEPDTLLGRRGDDLLKGFAGDDLLGGGAGNDTLVGGDGFDSLAGAAGDDTLLGGTGADNLVGGDGDDLLGGGDGGDRLKGGDGHDTLRGGDHNDQLIAGLGDDLVDGGPGVDELVYNQSGPSVVVNLATGVASGEGDDTLVSIEFVLAGRGSDSLTGTAGVNRLVGFQGSDTLQGGGDADVLYSGPGADVFVYVAVTDSLVSAPDFLDAEYRDVIDLSSIDADPATAPDDAFVLVSAFSHTAGELRVTFDSGAFRTYVDADLDGDGHSDMRLVIDLNRSDYDNFVL